VTLRGEITAPPDAAAANVLLVLAEEGSGTGLFAIDPTSDGVVVTARPHGSDTKAVRRGLDGVTAALASASADARDSSTM
jgi:hypothetical protein